MQIYKKILNFYLVVIFFTFCQADQKDKKKFSSLTNLIFLKNKDSDSSSSSEKSSKPKSKPKSKPNLNVKDPLYKDQWYLKNTGQSGGTSGVDINIEPVWEQGYTGKGINVAVLDTPFNSNKKIHEDLEDNLAISNINTCIYTDIDLDEHAISVSGIIAGRDNSLGVRGIAFRSQLFLSTMMPSCVVDSFTRNIREVAVSNNSWGVEKFDLSDKYRSALNEGLKEGFYGKGTVYVFSAGNDPKINTTVNGLKNFYGLLLVNALDDDGKHIKLGERFYSIGSNLWISAPGYKIITTTSYFNEGKYSTGYTTYERDFRATSAAAPVVSGVSALIREANSKLNWRDVKLILAESAVKNDPNHSGWKKGGSKKIQPSKSFEFSHNYGFGMVNALNAIDLAKKWKNLPPIKKVESSLFTPRFTISDTEKTDVITITDDQISFIESVTLELNLKKNVNIGSTEDFDLQLKHNNMVSHLYMKGKRLPFNTDGNNEYYDKGQISLTMLTNAHLGQVAKGEWSLQIKDKTVFTQLESWKLIIRGH